MTDVRIEAARESDPRRLSADILIVPVTGDDLGSSWLRALEKATGGDWHAHAREVGFAGKRKQTLLHRIGGRRRVKSVLLVGLGSGEEATPEVWRRAGGSALPVATRVRAGQAVAWITSDEVRSVVAFAEGMALAGYRFDRFRKKPPKEEAPRPVRLRVVAPDADSGMLRSALGVTRSVLPGVFVARDLVNEPPSVLTPAELARRARALCRGTGVRVEVMGPSKIRSMQMHGLLAVNRGSREEPRFLRFRYRPRKAKGGKRGKGPAKIALVGKGITFDSGGLSLKPAKAMETMKLDMAGAAAVIGTMLAVGRLKPNVEVTGYVAATENLPGERAQKPGDVIRYRNGTSVEVLNTDAEGRLVLADALILAERDRNDVIVDLATLTGACMVALGTRVAGVMGNDDDLVRELVEAGRGPGEDLWPLPLPEDYRSMLDSKVADIKNIGGPYGGTLTAGLFLKEFVEKGRWAHIDIAGPAFTETPLPYCPAGGTGFGIRTLTEWLSAR